MSFLRSIDAFRTIPKDLSEGTLHGAVLTVCAVVLCAVLFLCELNAFMTVDMRTRIVMDSNQDKMLKINFDVTMFDLDCDHVSVGVWDSFGTDRLNITRNVMRQRIDHTGTDVGVPYTEDELLELESQEQHLTTQDKAEYDADWSSSSDNFKHNDFEGVIESHDFTMLLFYADWCPPCRAFKPVWDEFERNINEGKGPAIVDADGKMVDEVRVLKMNCVDFKEVCMDEAVMSYPTARVYKRGIHSHHEYATFEGDRTVKALNDFLRDEVRKQHLHTGAHHHNVFKTGCRLRGFVEVARVPGTLHFESKASDTKVLNTAFTNVSHEVHHLSFGDETPVLASGGLPLPKEYRTYAAPLNGRKFVVDQFHQAPHHYVKVVSTTFASWNNMRSYQMTHQHRVANIARKATPQAKVSYDLAPVEVIVTEERRKKWYDFFTSALAIVGGTYTVLGIASGALNMASRAFKDKIGKLG